MRLETILYIVQVVSLGIALFATIAATRRTLNAINYMETYIKDHQNKKGVVSKEFKKVIKMLGGK